MAEKTCIKINGKANVRFYNNVDFCVGTGRLGLGLTAEYLEQLKMVQEEIGFRHIRGHGLFHEDLSIYQEYEEDGVKKVEYNYTYIDRLFDAYLKLNIRPFIELGFMPKKMASGQQAIFYWQGNTTPPEDYSKWTDMVVALLKHLRARYGEEVLEWPIEVWNEPNLPGFWYKADMEEYFKLFKKTFKAIKAYDKRFTIGGPAVCGVRDEFWIRSFLEFCRDNKLAIDFVTRHHYTIEFPERAGHYDYSKLMKAEDGFANLKTSRDIIDSFDEYRGLPIHITEFSTSYTPKGVIHDTNLNAAFIAQQLSRLGDVNESYSYWTFGDVFEEQGVPFTPFHGGFGLVANGCIRKPTFWTFAFYKKLQDNAEKCVLKNDDIVVVKTAKGYAGIAWNLGKKAANKTLEFSAFAKDGYTFLTKTVDETTCNPLKLWHDLGEHANPSEEEIKLLRESDRPLIASARPEAKDGVVAVDLSVKPNGVVYFELEGATLTPDRGYDYKRVVTTR